MGVATAIAAGGAIASIGSSVAGMVGSNKRAKKAEQALENYQRQEIVNPYENLQVSRKGTDLALQQNTVNTQSMIEAMKGSGINGLAMLPQIQANTNNLNQQVTANLDQQYVNNENRKAEGVAMVQNMIENRENQDLAGIGQSMATAEQNRNQYLQSAVNGLGSGAMSIVSINKGNSFNNNSKIGTTSSIYPFNMNPFNITK